MRDKEDKIAVVLGVVFAILAMVFCTSCRTIKTVVEYRDREVIKTELQRDSVYLHDSVYVSHRGDTVFVDRWRTEYAYKYIARVDSFTRVDSIPYPVEVVREVRVRNGYDKFCSWFLWIVVVAGGIFVACKVLKRTTWGKAVTTAIKAFLKLK